MDEKWKIAELQISDCKFGIEDFRLQIAKSEVR